jgi:hypothetical protein
MVRYHGAWAPNAKIRSKVVLKSLPDKAADELEAQPRRRYQSWAVLLRRVFKKDVTHCPKCGGNMKILAAIMKADVIRKILEHLSLPFVPPQVVPARAPPLIPDFSY